MINLVLFSFFIMARKALAVDESFTICSVSRYCGRLGIRFPFFIQELQDSRCGYPGFNISCRNNSDPILSLPDEDYVIHDIFYLNQSFHVSKATPWNSDSVCSQSIRNISIPEDRFYLPPNQSELLLFFNCDVDFQPSLFFDKVACSAGNQTNSTFAVFKDDPLLNTASTYCNNATVVPVAFPEGGLDSMMNRGFLLYWTASNCSLCEATGGKCGFDYGTYHFKCFCPDRPHAWHCTPRDSSGFAKKIAAASSVVAVILVLFIIIAFCLKRKMMKTEEDKKIEAFLKGHQFLTPKRYTYSNIKHITKSFRDRLGKGGFGDVYKGKLKDGRHVAVKILNKSKGKGEDFINEVASISGTSHVNIVTLLGFCFEGSRRALIYEFVPNGSLEKFIFQRNAYDGQLNWETLYRIAVGIARGLEYLHRGCATPILHFDIKPHNILLDNDFCPKISDFGLAKLCKEKESAISMTGARGTVGYIAPEVFSRNFGKASQKSDVYSYGMMVLEMVGGRKNINVQVDRTSEIYFPDWIYDHIELDGLGLQDVTNETDRERVKKMAVVSLWCIQINPSDRPTMSRVVEMMEGTIDSLKIPPKPVLSSPPASPATSNSSTTPLS